MTMWQTSRFECKYMIPRHQVPAIRQWMLMFLAPDRFAMRHPGYVYSINSLYLDSADYELYRTTAVGMKNRFKLRIRCYDDNPATPLFFEIKRRVDRIIRKSRVTLSRPDAMALLRGEKRPSDVVADADLHHLESFFELMRGLGAGPVARIRYRREAYESTVNDMVRLTFDFDLAFAPTLDFNFALGHGDWHPVPMPGVLLEVKFTDYMPQWLVEMIRNFELSKVPFSKYNQSVERILSPDHQIWHLLQGV
jgi:SPX domain protein involved in polyphosphate accumulation